MIIESIKQGFRITHKNWQIVLLKIIVFVINIIGFFLLVGIPIALVVASLGVDLAHARDILPSLFENPAALLSKYLGSAILILLAFIIYITAVSFLLLYVFGGMLGVLRSSALNEQYKFSFKSFFEEAKKLFFPLLLLFSLAFFIVGGILFFLGILAGIIISMINSYYGETGTTLSIFAIYFFGLSGITVGLVGIIFSAYAAIALVVGKNKVIESFKDALRFVKDKPVAFLFYILLVVGVMTVNLLLIILGASFKTISVTGLLSVIPYQIISYLIRCYLRVVMWSSLVVFYVKGSKSDAYTAAYDI